MAAEPDAGADGELRPVRPPKRPTGCSTRPRCPVRRRPISRSAKNLYAMLTGRVTSLTGDARITPAGDAYVPLGMSRAEGRMREFDFYAADSLAHDAELSRSAPALRYVLALPFYPTNNSYTTVSEAESVRRLGVGNLFKPGTLTGTKTELRAVSGRAPTPTTPTATTSRRASGSRGSFQHGSGGLGRLIFGSEEGDSVIRARRRDGLPAAGHVGLHRNVRRQPGNLRST